MRKNSKIITIFLLVAIVCVACLSLVACNEGDGDGNGGYSTLTFTAPEGTPALAMLRLVTDNTTINGVNMQYQVVKPANIATEMASKNSDLVIMPVNAGANLIRQGADYKLVSIAVNGSLYMIGKTQEGGAITLDDIKGKTIACIGQTGVPGLVFRYVMSANGIDIVDADTTPSENQVSVQYVADGPAARALLANNSVDFAVVGEPAGTQVKSALSLNAEMNMQTEYAKVGGASNYPQAGLFVKSTLASDEEFMNALFSALEASKDWASKNASEVGAFAEANLYKSAVFPPESIARCAINCTRLDDAQKSEIIAFLSNVMPKDSQKNDIDWQGASNKIFA